MGELASWATSSLQESSRKRYCPRVVEEKVVEYSSCGRRLLPRCQPAMLMCAGGNATLGVASAVPDPASG